VDDVITVVFLGRLRDVAGTREQKLSVASKTTLDGLLTLLDAQLPGLAAQLSEPGIRVVLNKVLRPLSADAEIGPNDEVAFMPPVTGG